MIKKLRPKFKVRNILAIIGMVGLLLVILLNRHQLVSFFHLIKTLRWYVVLLIIIVQIISYFANAYYYRSILYIFNYQLGVMRLFEAALATNFVNYIIPSAGFAGAGYLSQALSPEVPRGQSFLMQLMRYALSALAVLAMMPVGFLLIIVNNHAAHSIVRVAIYSSIGILIFAFAAVAFVQQEKWLRQAINWATKSIKRLFPKFNKEKEVQFFVDEFYIGFREMTSKKLKMLIPFGWSIIYIIIEISTVYLSFLAFGKIPNPGVVIMGYLFANIASIFGGLLFSTGVFEIAMIGTFVALGEPFVLAFSVTLVYRVLNLLIGLPPGYVYYRKYLPKKS